MLTFQLLQRFKGSFFFHFKVLISNLFLKLIGSVFSPFQLKLHVLHLFRYVLGDSTLLAFYYANYDLNNQYYSILERLFAVHSHFIGATFEERTSIDSREKFYCKRLTRDLKRTFIRSIHHFLEAFYKSLSTFLSAEREKNYLKYLKARNVQLRASSTGKLSVFYSRVESTRLSKRFSKLGAEPGTSVQKKLSRQLLQQPKGVSTSQDQKRKKSSLLLQTKSDARRSRLEHQPRSRLIRQSSIQEVAGGSGQFTVETGNDAMAHVVSQKNVSLENRSGRPMILKGRKKLVKFERSKIKKNVRSTLADIDRMKRDFSLKSSFRNLNNLHSLNQSGKQASLSKGVPPKMAEPALDLVWKAAWRRNFESKKGSIEISGHVRKEIERRKQHRDKLEEAIELFNRKPKKGYLELLNVNPIYHAKTEIANRNLNRFLFVCEKISKKK